MSCESINKNDDVFLNIENSNLFKTFNNDYEELLNEHDNLDNLNLLKLQ